MSKIADSGEVETTEHGTDRKSAVGRIKLLRIESRNS